MSTVICHVDEGSPAARAGIHSGEILRSISGHPVRDVMDYKFYSYEEQLELCLENADGQQRFVSVHKGPGEDLGLVFDTYLMDKPRSCSNHCIFCFIDQLPKGLRKTLYFKDDDARLSFLLGNYVSMTNLSEDDLQRIMMMHISPIRISIHATEGDLRAKMLGNPRGAEGYKIMQRFAKAGIQMQCQIVLCPDVNDGEHLKRTLHDLKCLFPQVTSVSIVPVGLTRYRERLTRLKPVTKEKAHQVIKQVEEVAEEMYLKFGKHVFYCGDEFYLRGELPLPNVEYYEDFEQLENGIGMITLLRDEFYSALSVAEIPDGAVHCSLATGEAAAPLMRELTNALQKKWPQFSCDVYAIHNDFFGDYIDVAGLVVGRDLITQLKDKCLGQVLLIPECMLRHGGDMFLDNTTPDQVCQELHVPVLTTPNDGGGLLDQFLDLAEEKR